MISKKVAGEQIGRVAGLKGFPREEREAINELILAIQEARSEYQAKNIVDVFVRGIETMPCPAPADIRRLIFEANRREEPGISQEERKRLEASLCPHCQSNGFMDRNGYFERPGVGSDSLGHDEYAADEEAQE